MKVGNVDTVLLAPDQYFVGDGGVDYPTHETVSRSFSVHKRSTLYEHVDPLIVHGHTAFRHHGVQL